MLWACNLGFAFWETEPLPPPLSHLHKKICRFPSFPKTFCCTIVFHMLVFQLCRNKTTFWLPFLWDQKTISVKQMSHYSQCSHRCAREYLERVQSLFLAERSPKTNNQKKSQGYSTHRCVAEKAIRPLRNGKSQKSVTQKIEGFSY